jgi:hypothetical protein
VRRYVNCELLFIHFNLFFPFQVSTTALSQLSGQNDNFGVKWDFFYEPLKSHAITSTDPIENPWWGILQDTLKNTFDIESTVIDKKPFICKRYFLILLFY